MAQRVHAATGGDQRRLPGTRAQTPRFQPCSPKRAACGPTHTRSRWRRSTPTCGHACPKACFQTLTPSQRVAQCTYALAAVNTGYQACMPRTCQLQSPDQHSVSSTAQHAPAGSLGMPQLLKDRKDGNDGMYSKAKFTSASEMRKRMHAYRRRTQVRAESGLKSQRWTLKSGRAGRCSAQRITALT